MTSHLESAGIDPQQRFKLRYKIIDIHPHDCWYGKEFNRPLIAEIPLKESHIKGYLSGQLGKYYFYAVKVEEVKK